MKICLTGAQSTGKTTLLNTIRREKKLIDYSFLVEITRSLERRGLKINELGNDQTQKEIMKSHIINLQYKNSIMDRCLLDGVVYTHYLYKHGSVSKKILKLAQLLCEEYINEYDFLFYLTPEFQLVKDGVRSSNLLFRDEIVGLFEEYIRKYKLPIIIITGTVEERINQIYKHIEEKM